MDNARFSRAFKKALPITSSCYILSIVLFSSVCAILRWMIDPVIIVYMTVLFIILGIINVLRMYIDESKWALSKPYIVKNFIFMPAYFVITMAFVIIAFEGFDPVTILICAMAFIAVFMLMQTVTYFRFKKDTDMMNDALLEYQKEHMENGEE